MPQHKTILEEKQTTIAVSGGTTYDTPTPTDYIRFTGSVDTNVTGFTGWYDGRKLVLHNATTATIYLKSNAIDSFEQNQLLLPSNADVKLAPGFAAQFVYSVGASRWIYVGNRDPEVSSDPYNPAYDALLLMQSQIKELVVSMLTEEITADYTLQYADRGKFFFVNSTNPITITIPASFGSDYPRGAKFEFFRVGSGAVTIVKPDGFIVSDSDMSSIKANGHVTLLSAGLWYLYGDLTI